MVGIYNVRSTKLKFRQFLVKCNTGTVKLEGNDEHVIQELRSMWGRPIAELEVDTADLFTIMMHLHLEISHQLRENPDWDAYMTEFMKTSLTFFDDPKLVELVSSL